ncbi:unnamed protein product, partial [Didymodactylos carnosus]
MEDDSSSNEDNELGETTGFCRYSSFVGSIRYNKELEHEPLNLLIGTTGMGKRTLLNALCDTDQYISKGADPGTEEPLIGYVGNWPIVDTRGLNDKHQKWQNEAVEELQTFLFHGCHRLSTIILYLSDPVEHSRLTGDISDCLQSFRRLIDNADLDNVSILYRAHMNIPQPAYSTTLFKWADEVRKLDCVVREKIPVYAKYEFRAGEKVNVLIANLADIKKRLIRHRYTKYFGWRQAGCKKCGEDLYRDFDHGPCDSMSTPKNMSVKYVTNPNPSLDLGLGIGCP